MTPKNYNRIKKLREKGWIPAAVYPVLDSGQE